MRWYGYVLRREEGNVPRDIEFSSNWKRKRRPNATCKKQVDALIEDIGLRKDAPSRKKWLLGVEILKGNDVKPPVSVDNTV